MASAAGTNIGDAQQLTSATKTTPATGKLTSAKQDDWWVVYPASRGGSVGIIVRNTTPTSSNPCSSITVTYWTTGGTSAEALPGAYNLAPTNVDNTPIQAPAPYADTDRYFVEVVPQCAPPSGQPTTYSLAIQTGAGGRAPKPIRATAPVKTSMATAGPPLQGDTSYTGSIANGSGTVNDWFVLYKHADTNPATIRIENTTPKASVLGSGCSVLDMQLFLKGTPVPGNGNLSDNAATTYKLRKSGHYYLELTSLCPNGVTIDYRIEPEPAGEWDYPPTTSVTNTLALHATPSTTPRCPISGYVQCFTFQQNFFVAPANLPAGSHPIIWVQNVLYVLQTKGGVWKLHPRAEVFNAATGKFYKVVDGGYYTVKLPYTATLTTKVISTKAIAFTDSVVGTSPFYTWPNTSAYTFSTVAVGVSPATDPQAVLVGPGNSTGVTFLAGSAGTVSSSATLQAGTTAPGTVCPVSGTNLWTKETSTGLAWTVTGSKATFGTGAGTPAEGVVFMPQRLACP